MKIGFGNTTRNNIAFKGLEEDRALTYAHAQCRKLFMTDFPDTYDQQHDRKCVKAINSYLKATRAFQKANDRKSVDMAFELSQIITELVGNINEKFQKMAENNAGKFNAWQGRKLDIVETLGQISEALKAFSGVEEGVTGDSVPLSYVSNMDEIQSPDSNSYELTISEDQKDKKPEFMPVGLNSTVNYVLATTMSNHKGNNLSDEVNYAYEGWNKARVKNHEGAKEEYIKHFKMQKKALLKPLSPEQRLKIVFDAAKTLDKLGYLYEKLNKPSFAQMCYERELNIHMGVWDYRPEDSAKKIKETGQKLSNLYLEGLSRSKNPDRYSKKLTDLQKKLTEFIV